MPLDLETYSIIEAPLTYVATKKQLLHHGAFPTSQRTIMILLVSDKLSGPVSSRRFGAGLYGLHMYE
ncbi:hypothetical protein SERLA73DRAFT_187369, partial [Serpula lacrymans var. lacrymans S7.3]